VIHRMHCLLGRGRHGSPRATPPAHPRACLVAYESMPVSTDTNQPSRRFYAISFPYRARYPAAVGQLDQLAKEIFAEETAAVTGGGAAWILPGEIGLSAVRLDGLLRVRQPARVSPGEGA
jgi:hypothetical protein